MHKRILVTGLSGLSTSVAEWLKKKEKNDVFQISLRNNTWKTFDFKNVDVVVHIVGITPAAAKSREEYYSVNTELTKQIAEKAKRSGVGHFIYFSSMAVYGAVQQIDKSKGMVFKNTPTLPMNDYGKSKLQAEEYVRSIKGENFNVSIVRLPSVYGKGKTEYLDQYKYLAEKFPILPIVFPGNFKSAIYIDNLCELVFFIIKNPQNEIICPDDGEYAAVDYCSAIYPQKKKSRLVGRVIELLMYKNERIIDYYGCVCYSKELSEVFGGEYRVVPFKDAVMRSYK